MIARRAAVRRRILGGSVVALLAAGVAAAAAPPGIPRAWIDDPLAWSTVASIPVTVVAHATDPDGVASVRLSVDGSPMAVAAASGDELVTVELPWTPPGSGVFVLEVVGIDPSGEEGMPASEPVRVVLDEETTSTTGGPTTTAGRTTTTVVRTTTTAPATTTTAPATTTTAPPTTTTTAPPTTTTAPATTTTIERTTTTVGRTTTTTGR